MIIDDTSLLVEIQRLLVTAFHIPTKEEAERRLGPLSAAEYALFQARYRGRIEEALFRQRV